MDETVSDKDHVNLLWTGGWDSTFQLLRLLMVQRVRVTPYYLIHAERLSTGMEILTMKRIKSRLLEEYPHTASLLLPTRYFAMGDLSPDPEITDAFQSVLKSRFMGAQYEWLARFAKESRIPELQLCVHRDDKAHHVIEQFVTARERQVDFRIDESFRGTAEYRIFQYFSFPLFDMTKTEMSRIAAGQGWGPIMQMTWFCHAPTRNKEPCGKCNPCRYTIEEGLGHRIPARRRAAGFFHVRVNEPIDRVILQPMKIRLKTALKRIGLLEYVRRMRAAGRAATRV